MDRLRILVFSSFRPIAMQCFASIHNSKQKNIVRPWRKDHKRSKLKYHKNSWPNNIFKNISFEKIKRKIFYHCNYLKSFNCYSLLLWSKWWWTDSTFVLFLNFHAQHPCQKSCNYMSRFSSRIFEFHKWSRGEYSELKKVMANHLGSILSWLQLDSTSNSTSSVLQTSEL